MTSLLDKKYIFENPFVKITRTVYHEGVIMSPHSHEHTAISMILSGANHETVDDYTDFGGASSLIIKPANITHNNLFSDGCTILSIYLKDEKHTKIKHDGLLKDWNWLSANDYTSLLYSLINSNTSKNYYTSLNDFLSYLKLKKETALINKIPKWVLEVKNILDQDYHESIQTKELAKEFNVHPVYLSRVYNNYFGMSIKSYLKIRRVNSVMSSIINNKDNSLASTALENGFVDQSHLNKVFKPVTGFTPNQFKNLIY